MMRSIRLAILASMVWGSAAMAAPKCESAAVSSYKEGVNLMMAALEEPGPGKWWKGEPQISYDFEIVNNHGQLAVKIRPTSGGISAFVIGDGITLSAKICKLVTAQNEPNSVQLSIDTSQYYGQWSNVYLSKIRSALHVNWDGKVALLKPTN